MDHAGKESYAINASVLRLAHVHVSCGDFSIFTDHKNILYMLSPTRSQANMVRHIVHKVQRWAIRLSEFNYTVEHIPGKNNVWADMLTRWAAPNFSKSPARRVSAIRVPLITEEKPDLPSLEVIQQSQRKNLPQNSNQWKFNQKIKFSNNFIEAEEEPSQNVELWENEKGQLFIPPEGEELQLRIIVAAHCGLSGHHRYATTCNIIKEKVFWDTIDPDVKEFVQVFLSCLLSGNGVKVPSPLGQQVHAERVGKLLHFDYVYVGESSDGKASLLILKDDFSGYVFLQPCSHADAETTAEVLMEYFTTFVPVLSWFSEQGTHFKNELIELLATVIGAKHRFSTVYVP